MNEQFLPTDFNGKLWHFAEEIGEVLYVAHRWNLYSAEPIAFEILADFHKAACKMGRFGPRADLTGTAMKLNNARDMLEQWYRLEGALGALVRFTHVSELQAELDDLARAAKTLRLELVTMT